MTDTIQQPSLDEVGRAWRYHDAADSILAGRLQSLLVSQAFIVGAYITLIARQKDNPGWLYAGVMAAIILLGLVSSFLLGRRVKAVVRGIDWLKTSYLVHDPVYSGYYGAVTKGRRGRAHTRVKSVHVPVLFETFWLLMAAHWVLLFQTVWGGI